MERKERSIGVNALLNGLKTILSVIFPLITYPYAARVLQVENVGKVNFSEFCCELFCADCRFRNSNICNQRRSKSTREQRKS